jgi:adenylylsulfate kinase-like enzyme
MAGFGFAGAERPKRPPQPVLYRDSRERSRGVHITTPLEVGEQRDVRGLNKKAG